MRKLSLLILIGTLGLVPAFANVNESPASDDKAKIERLELEVKKLTEALNTMRMQYTTLQTQLESVRKILGDGDIIDAANEQELDAQLCITRLSELKQTQAKLISLGYTDQHPDAVSVNRSLKKRMLECGDQKADRNSSGS